MCLSQIQVFSPIPGIISLPLFLSLLDVSLLSLSLSLSLSLRRRRCVVFGCQAPEDRSALEEEREGERGEREKAGIAERRWQKRILPPPPLLLCLFRFCHLSSLSRCCLSPPAALSSFLALRERERRRENWPIAAKSLYSPSPRDRPSAGVPLVDDRARKVPPVRSYISPSSSSGCSLRLKKKEEAAASCRQKYLHTLAAAVAADLGKKLSLSLSRRLPRIGNASGKGRKRADGFQRWGELEEEIFLHGTNFQSENFSLQTPVEMRSVPLSSQFPPSHLCLLLIHSKLRISFAGKRHCT